MGGNYNCTSVIVALLLYCTLSMVEPSPVTVNYSPNTTTCGGTRLLDATGGTALSYSCDITHENRDPVLDYIKGNHIKSLSIVVTEGYQDFAFGNESFSTDLQLLAIYAFYPMLISSGTFLGSERIYFITLYQKYEVVAADINNTTMSREDTHWDSLQFEPGWLAPLTGLINANLSHNSIERFPDMQFCHLKYLKLLDISSNRINSSDGLGIICNSLYGPCTPCLPNVEYLSIANNPIKNLNMNFSYNLPLVKKLNMSGCSLTSINFGQVLSNFTEVLDMSYNKLSFLIMDAQGICNGSQLTTLFLQRNKLQTIPAGLFGCMNHIRYLDLSSNLLGEESLINGGLNDLPELEWLVLSYNKLHTLHAGLVGNIFTLSRFYCSRCGLRMITNDTFINLRNLQYLALDNNSLLSIESSTFVQLYRLLRLDLSNNLLINIPDFSQQQPNLQALALDSNSITEIKPARFHGLSRLRYLSLAFNEIKTIPDNAFSSMTILQRLDLSNNKLKTVHYYGLDPLLRLETLRLNNNFLTAIPPLKLNLKVLVIVDLSHNLIRNIHLAASDTLELIDLSFNNITKFESPLSILEALRLISLKFNNLRELSEDVFLTYMKPRPKVYLEGNPLHCDCQMEWLLDTKFNRPYEEKHNRKFQGTNDKNFKTTINDFKAGKPPSFSRFYAEVADLDTLQCTTSDSGGKRTPFFTITTADFVCPYQDECSDWGCYESCCTQDTNCPCRAVCYPDCSCYHNHNHENNFMNCTSRNITNLPHKGPIYVKKIYLDGNNLTNLTSDHLDFPQLTALFANKSNVLNIHEGAFKKLKLLKILDLQQNHIEQIRSTMFMNVLILKELYLQNNQLDSIANESFLDLLYLRILKLHGNNLKYLNFSLFEGIKLRELSLHDNPWSCDCDFGPVFQKWLIKQHKIVQDIEQIYCINITSYPSWDSKLIELNTGEPGSEFTKSHLMNTPLIYIDFSKACNNVTFLTEYKHTKSITEVASLAAAFGVFMLIVIVVYKNLLLIKVCMYNWFGVRLHREEKDNTDRPYDIFLTYAKQDDRFVVQHLLPELETGDKSYRGRDWPPGADKCETIITSVQQSKRTILLVSEHHFNTQWCEFSFEAGHYQVLMDKQIRLIIILTDRNLEARMNRTMKMYTRTNAFLVVGEKWFWKKLRYYLADKPRGADDEVGREFTLMEVYKKART